MVSSYSFCFYLLPTYLKFSWFRYSNVFFLSVIYLLVIIWARSVH
jgi:hypothetical protein